MNRTTAFLLFHFLINLPLTAQQPHQILNPWGGTGLIPDSILTLLDKQSRITKSSIDDLIPIRPGWPVFINSIPEFPLTADINQNGMKEIVVGDRNGYVHIFDIQGEYISYNWPVKLGSTVSSPAVADLDGDGNIEIIAIECLDLNSDYWPNGRVHVLDLNASHLDGWPFMLDGMHKYVNSVSIGDINNDGYKDILTATGTKGYIGSNTLTYFQKIYAFNYDGTLIPGWPIEPDLERRPRSPILIVDLNRDGYNDIVSGFCNWGSGTNAIYAFNHDGTVLPDFFPVETEEINYAIAAADMNGDGDYEIVTHGRKIKSNGFNDNDWRRQEWIYSYLAFADVDQDGLPDLITGNAGYHAGVNVVDKYGRSLPGWPVDASGDTIDYVHGNPVAGDIDGDDDIEVLIGTLYTHNIYAWHHDGTPVEGFPLKTGGINSRIAISDLDGDGDIELISACEDGWIYVWDIPSTGPCTKMEWPMYQHDMRHTGVYPTSYNDVPDDNNTVQPVDFVLQQNYPNPFNSETRIPYTLSGRTNMTLSIVDLRGRTVTVLEQGVQNAGRHEAAWNAENVSSGVYLAQLRVGSEVLARKLVVTK